MYGMSLGASNDDDDDDDHSGLTRSVRLGNKVSYLRFELTDFDRRRCSSRRTKFASSELSDSNQVCSLFFPFQIDDHRRRILLRIGIKLLGFKDLDQLAIEDNVIHSMFIYPDESVRVPLYFCFLLIES